MAILAVKIETKGDVKKLLKENEERMYEIIDTLADVSRAEWIRLAGERLHSTYREYVMGLNTSESIVKTGKGFSQVSLVGWLPNAVENGLPSFDMKPGFLASPKAKVSKKGKKYLRIPLKSFTRKGRIARGTNIRTASELSPPESWIHPGIEPRNLASEVVKYSRNVFKELVRRELRQ